MKLFTEKGGAIHAIDIDSVRPILTLNYYFRSSQVDRYVAYQFYNHPANSHFYLKMVVSRCGGEYKETLCSVITRAELCDFVSHHAFSIYDSDILNLIKEGVITSYRFGQARNCGKRFIEYIAELQKDADRWKQVISNTNGLGLSVRVGTSYSVLYGADAVQKVDSIRAAKRGR